MASLLSSGFGGIFAYALSLIRVGNGMFRAGWRWIFIIEGIVTVVAGLVSPFFLVECKASFSQAQSLNQGS
jgi:MFS family permease